MPPTPLIGRKAQIEAARRLLQCAEVRLLTLTGAGGVGKTSLALAVAAELAGAREQGIHFVDLAAVTESDQVPLAIARGLRLPDERTDGRWDRLLWTMRKQHLLIVLDNFEQVIDAASSVGELVVACPNVRVLVTSRSPLRLRSEYVLPVRPLELPDRGQSSDVEAVLRSPAGALFVQRARAVDPDFTLTPSTAQAVVEICARLDGLPLAIELAAGRTQLLTPNEILARLQQPLDLLEGGPRDQPPRHQSLRAAIAWSYDLMRPAEQALLGLLAVFVGGAALETVEAIALSSAAQSTLASR
ncbi:MAG TPA: NB-ARC domain-containing protein, partial [Chloroflexota bacterium]